MLAATCCFPGHEQRQRIGHNTDHRRQGPQQFAVGFDEDARFRAIAEPITRQRPAVNPQAVYQIDSVSPMGTSEIVAAGIIAP